MLKLAIKMQSGLLFNVIEVLEQSMEKPARNVTTSMYQGELGHLGAMRMTKCPHSQSCELGKKKLQGRKSVDQLRVRRRGYTWAFFILPVRPLMTSFLQQVSNFSHTICKNHGKLLPKQMRGGWTTGDRRGL